MDGSANRPSPFKKLCADLLSRIEHKGALESCYISAIVEESKSSRADEVRRRSRYWITKGPEAAQND